MRAPSSLLHCVPGFPRTFARCSPPKMLPVLGLMSITAVRRTVVTWRCEEGVTSPAQPDGPVAARL
jgi:hypothetical protein